MIRFFAYFEPSGHQRMLRKTYSPTPNGPTLFILLETPQNFLKDCAWSTPCSVCKWFWKNPSKWKIPTVLIG